MKLKKILSILLNVVGVIGPAVVLFGIFGSETAIDPESTKHLIALLGTALFSFAAGLGAAWLLRDAEKSLLVTILEDVLGGSKGAQAKREATSRQAA